MTFYALDLFLLVIFVLKFACSKSRKHARVDEIFFEANGV